MSASTARRAGLMSSPDQRAFEIDIAKPTFRVGEVEGRWRLIKIEWPHAFISVTARDGSEFTLRLDCTGYPQSPPTGGPWDISANRILPFNQWPMGRGGRVSAVFRPDWKSGSALYLPCDRASIAGHNNWVSEMPSKIWRPALGIILYLELVHELLHCPDYTSPHSTAA